MKLRVVTGVIAAAAMSFLLLPAAASAQTSDKHAKVGPTDATFIRSAGQSNAAEIDVTKLAASKADNPQVKQFAEDLQKQHEQLNKDLDDLADKKDVKVPDPTTQQKTTKDQLDKLKGPAFDRAFISEMVKDHQMAVTEYTKAAKSTDPDVKNLAEKTLPTLKDHLQRAKDLQKDVAPSTAGKGKGGN
jgi:putative membrane protein